VNRFICPKCKLVVDAIASSAAHKCPSNKSLMTAFELAGPAPSKRKKEVD